MPQDYLQHFPVRIHSKRNINYKVLHLKPGNYSGKNFTRIHGYYTEIKKWQYQDIQTVMSVTFLDNNRS